MMTNREIRSEAWRLLWTGGWIVRLMVAGLVLTGTLLALLLGLSLVYRQLEISTLQDFIAAWQRAAAEGMGYTASSDGAMARMIAASLFQGFMQHLFSGLALFGVVTLTLRTMRGDRTRWFAQAFSGFGAPFSVFWLMFGVQVRMGFWLLLASLPAGILASVFPFAGAAVTVLILTAVLGWCIYRYRNVWFLYVDHPDWSAGRCISESVRTMKGWKRRAMALDCSFLGVLSGVFALLLAGFVILQRVLSAGLAGLSALTCALIGALGLFAVAYMAIAGWYITLAHAVFYREMASA